MQLQDIGKKGSLHFSCQLQILGWSWWGRKKGSVWLYVAVYSMLVVKIGTKIHPEPEENRDKKNKVIYTGGPCEPICLF